MTAVWITYLEGYVKYRNKNTYRYFQNCDKCTVHWAGNCRM